MTLLYRLLLLFVLCLPVLLAAQTNIISTNPLAEQILLGNYDPAPYSGAAPLDPSVQAALIEAAISPDSLKAYIEQLSAFQNRNSGSNTLSAQKGIGAARNWVLGKFNEFSAANNQRLAPSFLQFDQSSFEVKKMPNNISKAFVVISDMSGKIQQSIPVSLKEGLNEIMYQHGYGVYGTYAYSLVVDGQIIDTRQMIFAN